MTNWPKIHLLEGRLRWWKGKAAFRDVKLGFYKVKGDRAHHWLKVNEAAHNARGIASDRKQIAEIRPFIAKWQKLSDEAHAEIRALAHAIAALKPKPAGVPQGEGYSVPKTAWNPYRRKIANWIVREVTEAVRLGAQGYVTSGVRTWAEQVYLYWLYRHGGNVAAVPGKSNHQGWIWPRGAIDWSDPSSLWSALKRKARHRLIWAESIGFRDHPHFSSTGH